MASAEAPTAATQDPMTPAANDAQVNGTSADAAHWQEPPELDDARIQEKAERYYYRNKWGAYKGHVRGMVTGVMIGVALAALIGAAMIPVLGALSITLPVLSIAGYAVSGAAALIFSFAGLGGILAAEAFGAVGAATASRSTSLAEKHARQLVRMPSDGKENPVMALLGDDPTYEGSHKHHYEMPPDRDRNTFYHLNTGAIGAAIGTGMGALVGTFLHGISILADGATMGMTGIPIVSASTAIAGLFGASFGINRAAFRSFFNWSDGIAHGRTQGLEITAPHPQQAIDQAATPEKAKEAQALYDVQLKRQTLIEKLERNYYDRIFWNAIGGRFKGFMGGPTLGLILGAAIGVGAALLAPGLSLAIIPLCAAAGATTGLKIFTEAGTEGGAEAMSKAIDEEHQRALACRTMGIDPKTKLTESAPPAAPGGLFNFKAGLTSAIVLGIVGAGAFAGMAAGLGALIGVAVVGKTIAAAYGSIQAAALACGALGALTGATYGISPDILKKFGKVAHDIYDGKIFGIAGQGHEVQTQKSIAYAPQHAAPAAENKPEPKMEPAASKGASETITADDLAKLYAATSNRPAQPDFAARIAAKAAEPVLVTSSARG